MNYDAKRTRRVLEPVSVTRDTERDMPTVRLSRAQIDELIGEKPAIRWQLFAIGVAIMLFVGFVLGLERKPPPMPPPVKYTPHPGEKLVAIDIPLPAASAERPKRLLQKRRPPPTDTKRPLFNSSVYQEM